MTPSQKEMKTPNTVLATPYRTKEGQVAMTPGQAGTPLATPLRDKLAINPSEAFMEGGSTMGEATGGDSKFYLREVKETLKLGLSTLPAPKNDFEVVPENEEVGGGGEDVEMADDANTWIEDQADLDQQTEEEYRARREKELRRRSQAVQRDLPRPTDMNDSVLRPLNSDPPLTELQRAEELVKREMIVMMHHDCVETPTPAQMGEGAKKKAGGEKAIVNEQLHRAFLERHPYQQFSEEEMVAAKELLQKEMETVKAGMDHNLSDQAYTQVWEECLAQVLYLPSQRRYTRANLASKKDRIESLRERLETNRAHMTKEAKRAAKIEKKLKVLTGGYQARAQGLFKQINDLNDQISQSRLDFSTFEFLKDQETRAIPKRLSSLTDDVERQTSRERELQKRYRDMKHSAAADSVVVADVQAP